MTATLRAAGLEWRDDVPAQEWDRALAALGGHPLQSALWGEARRRIDGTVDRRWMALRDRVPVWLARIELRPLPGRWVGWIPRGPTGEAPDRSDFPAFLRQECRQDGVVLLVTDPWVEIERGAEGCGGSKPRTIWIDLSVGAEALWKNLDKQWRYGVGRAQRLGVCVEMTADPEDVARFGAICKTVADSKRVVLPGSVALMQKLVGSGEGDVEARLFLARFDGALSAGALVLRCGRSLHYIWGATDRSMAHARAGEAVQWAVIEWGIAQGCTRYDLEGIDPGANPGTYAFKKKMGGAEVILPGKSYFPLGAYGRLAGWLAAMRG